MMKVIVGAALALLSLTGAAQASAAEGAPCARPQAGSEIERPADLYSKNGALNVAFGYYTSMDSRGRTLFCFVTPDGLESPTLHVRPGDTLKLSLTNMIPQVTAAPSEVVSGKGDACGDTVMTIASVNIHFHGANVSPACHSDEVIRTLVNPGQTFEYVIHIPKDEPPGLYWYHPHVHGISSKALQGGPTGAIEVEGIADIQPIVAGLPERYIVLRDQQLATSAVIGPKKPVPNWDVSVNYVPVNYPEYIPAVIKMQEGAQEFWRVVNAGANTIMDIQVTYDGVAQPLQVVAFDGVPTGSKNGTRKGSIVTQYDILLPPAARAEFVIAAPASPSTVAVLKTLSIDGGPIADSNPARPLATIITTKGPASLPRLSAADAPSRHFRFDDLAEAKVTATRKLIFSEFKPPAGAGDTEGAVFYITVKGKKEKPFDPNEKPRIVTTRGAVEEWTIFNHSAEVHEFHIHQIHFLVEEVNGVKIPKDQQQIYDTFQVPYKQGFGRDPYIKIKLDFRGPTVGDFVYHCHILDHEDGGMMAKIRVLPQSGRTRAARARRPFAQSASAVAPGWR